MNVADLHSELQDKPAHSLDTLVAVASSAWPSILTVVTVSVVDLGAMVVFFWKMIIRRSQEGSKERFKIIKIAFDDTIFESWLVGWMVGWF